MTKEQVLSRAGNQAVALLKLMLVDGTIYGKHAAMYRRQIVELLKLHASAEVLPDGFELPVDGIADPLDKVKRVVNLYVPKESMRKQKGQWTGPIEVS